MIRHVLTLCLLFTAVCSSVAQNSDTALISITNFKLFPGTYSWRDGESFHDMTNWNSSSYTQGHLKQLNGSNWQFRMNYRLLFPQNYNAGYDKGYPLLIMLHGAGERGNCWEANCYCKDCDPNKPEDGKATPAYLNNDHMLVHGGEPFMKAVNLAGSKKADDPSLDPAAFPGFVLFPQAENTWGNAESAYSSISYALRILRLVMKEHNVNPDRVYIAGLSMGGQGVLKALSMADWLFSAAIAMSPVPYTKNFNFEGAVTVPIWIFQGGLDQLPKPAHTEEFIELFREVGGSVRYTFYPEAGHNTWSRAFREPDFFSWLLQYKRNDIFSYFGTDYICATSDEGVPLALPAGFPAYQWEKDGAVVAGETDSLFTAKEPGTYRARFTRVESPGEDDWGDWSAPLTLETEAPPSPSIKHVGTTFLPDLNSNNDAILFTESQSPYYFWEKDAGSTTLPDTSRITLTSGSCSGACSGNGTYALRVADYNGCKSSPSNLVTVFFSDQAPVINEMRPDALTATPMSSSSVFLTWNDVSGLEQGYEIWRKNTSVAESAWQMATLTSRSVSFYYDTMLIPGSVYQYKIRAISSKGRSDYFPANDVNENIEVTLSDEGDQPIPPQEVSAVMIDINTALVTWRPARDESGISHYTITFGEQVINTSSADTTYVVKDVPLNQRVTINVQAVDISGNVSTPGNQFVLSTAVNGLFYKHSTGAWNSLADPAIQDTWTSPEYTGHVANLTLQPRVQEEYFNFEFNGYLFITTAGQYSFYLNSDDGSQLFIDDELVIDFDGFHGVCNGDAQSTTCPNGWGRPSGPVNLTQGRHAVKVRFFQYTGGKNIFLRYNGPDTGGSTELIPDGAWTSGTAGGQMNPAAPSALAGTAIDMRTIALSWNASPSPAAEYEVYRSLASGGPYEIITRVAETDFNDTNLIPGTTYHYRLRAVTSSGNSPYTSSIAVQTVSDTEKPTVPQLLRVESGNFSRAVLRWDPSTDNVGIAGYEIWADDKRIGFSKVPAFDFTAMEQGKVYWFHVVAVDISGNRSNPSEKINNESFVTDVTPEKRENFSLSVFPNPASPSELTIRISSVIRHEISITITDVTQRTIFRKTLNVSPGDVDVRLPSEQFLPDGLYFVDVKQGDTNLQRKLVIRN